jgi:hypothetical protein
MNIIFRWVFLTSIHLFIQIAYAGKEDPLRDPSLLPGVKREGVVRLASARVVIKDVALIHKDFPETVGLSDDALDHWLVERAGYIGSHQLNQGGAAHVSSEVPIDASAPPVEAFRPQGYGRALVVPVPGVSGKLSGLLDIKGVGTESPKMGHHKDGLTPLSEAIREYYTEKLVQKVFDRDYLDQLETLDEKARHFDAKGVRLEEAGRALLGGAAGVSEADRLALEKGRARLARGKTSLEAQRDAVVHHRTIGTYAILDTGFDVNRSSDDAHPFFMPAGLAVRQAHVRSQEAHAMLKPQDATEIEVILRKFGLTTVVPKTVRSASDEGGAQVDMLNVQGSVDGAVIDFGSYFVSTPMRAAYVCREQQVKPAVLQQIRHMSDTLARVSAFNSAKTKQKWAHPVIAEGGAFPRWNRQVPNGMMWNGQTALFDHLANVSRHGDLKPVRAVLENNLKRVDEVWALPPLAASAPPAPSAPPSEE